MNRITAYTFVFALVSFGIPSGLRAEETQKTLAKGPFVEFVYVPGGRADFVDLVGKEYPQDVAGFWVSKHEITGEPYDLFLKHFKGGEGLKHPREPANASYGPTVASEGNLPLRGVSWFGAYTFCRWSGGSLPSYEEWFKAGFWNPDAQKRAVYPWGDSNDVSYNQDKTKTFPLDSFPSDVSYYGVRNMAGAPVEWIDKWEGEKFTVGMGYYGKGGKGQSFNVDSPHEECGFRIVLHQFDLGQFLSKSEREYLSALVAQLGSATFAEREDAEKKLAAAGILARSVLAEYVDSPDPEVQLRVRAMLSQKAVLTLQLTVIESPSGLVHGAWIPASSTRAQPSAGGELQSPPTQP